ncbi:hypothetical protein AB1Y20_022145 [Prymnesium parvum]|uniref:Nucleotide-diphospho-sugar transferase domain-containing protein n=1 Tax=Prymnesium parvum TaxID=97485 RepID=A0AB34JIS1_PRYPA
MGPLPSFIEQLPGNGFTSTYDRRSVLSRKCRRTPIHGKCLSLINVSSAVSARLAVSSSCVPSGAVLLSMVNPYHSRLRDLQFSRLRESRCFMDRVVSVCFNYSDSLGTCVPAPHVEAARFRSGGYSDLLWAKWRFIADALVAASMVLWVDADVVLLRNPWANIPLRGRQHLLYQPEHPPVEPMWRLGARECVKQSTPRINGGQILVRSARFARQVAALRPLTHTSSNRDKLDQDYASELLYQWNYSHCLLPAGFRSQLWSQRRPNGKTAEDTQIFPLDHSSSCQLVTLHVNGQPSRLLKERAMTAVLGFTTNCVQLTKN